VHPPIRIAPHTVDESIFEKRGAGEVLLGLPPLLGREGVALELPRDLPDLFKNENF
jgi:hypothetical protein